MRMAHVPCDSRIFHAAVRIFHAVLSLVFRAQAARGDRRARRVQLRVDAGHSALLRPRRHPLVQDPVGH